MNGRNGPIPSEADIVIIGGGIAGLVAANFATENTGGSASRRKPSVLLLEKGHDLGGRAGTNVRDGVSFNMGPHALYCHGALFRTLHELQIPFHGAPPNPGRSLFLTERSVHRFPQTFWQVLVSRLLNFRERRLFLQILGRGISTDPRTLDSTSVADWIRQLAGTGRLADLFHTLMRLTTFVNDPEQQSAGATLEQFQMGQKGGVWYVDGGWTSLVEGLRRRAVERGVSVRPSAPAKHVRTGPNGSEIELADGTRVRAGATILAVPPAEAVGLLDLDGSDPLRVFERTRRVGRCACLDIALQRLPRPDERFTLGLDAPLYFSVHSAAAKLGPDGVAVAHVMKYLPAGEPIRHEETRNELETMLDRIQPGWRADIVTSRYLPNMTAVPAIPTIATRGTQDRPDSVVAGRPGVFLAGDWVGRQGQLVDASAASGRIAAAAAIESLSRSTPSAARRHGPVLLDV